MTNDVRVRFADVRIETLQVASIVLRSILIERGEDQGKKERRFKGDQHQGRSLRNVTNLKKRERDK
jgi:hypothetical protein